MGGSPDLPWGRCPAWSGRGGGRARTLARLRPLRRPVGDRQDPEELTKGDIDVLADERRYRRTAPLQDPDGRLAVTVGARALDDTDRERR